MANNRNEPNSTRYDLFTVEERGQGQDVKKFYHKVGSAWLQADKEGTPYISIKVIPNVAIGGSLVAFIPKEREGK